MGQRHHKSGNAIPCAVTEAIGLGSAIGDQNLSFFHIAGVVDGILVLLHQIRVTVLSDGGDFNFFHSRPSRHQTFNNRILSSKRNSDLPDLRDTGTQEFGIIFLSLDLFQCLICKSV